MIGNVRPIDVSCFALYFEDEFSRQIMSETVYKLVLPDQLMSDDQLEWLGQPLWETVHLQGTAVL